MFPKVRPRRPRASVTLLGVAALLSLFIGPGLRLDNPTPRETQAPIQLGTSFSPWRARALGLAPEQAFGELLGLHFAVIRLAARWNMTGSDGGGELDRLMAMAAAAHQPVLLEVGVKSLGWPEFYPPAGLLEGIPDGGDVGTDPILRTPLLAFVRQVVLRYRNSPVLVGWQVENEPFNAAGPHRWWIDAQLLQAEMATVRELSRKPIVVNAFTHFNALFDRVSSSDGLSLANLLGFESNGAEPRSLGMLRPGDVLGLDVYTRIGYRVLGQDGLSLADADWASRAGEWLARARAGGADAWVTEAEAEPWEASGVTSAQPRSLHPNQVGPDGRPAAGAGLHDDPALGQRVLALARGSRRQVLDRGGPPGAARGGAAGVRAFPRLGTLTANLGRCRPTWRASCCSRTCGRPGS